MTNERRDHWAYRAGRIGVLVGMGLLGLLDLVGALTYVTPTVTVGLIRLGVTAGTLALWLPAHPERSRDLPRLALMLATASCLASVMAVVTSDASATWGLSEALGLSMGLLVVARRGESRPAVLAATVTLFALVIQPLRIEIDSVMVALGMVQGMIGSGAVGLGYYLRHLDGTRHQQLLLTKAQQRAEFARDLHDFIAHHVTGIVVQAQGARLVAERDPGRALQALDQIERAGGEAMTAMRRMVGVLRQSGEDAPLAPLQTLDDLEPLVRTFTEAGGPAARLHLEGDLAGVPADLGATVCRVVMESLTNVRRHGREVTEVLVSVRRTRDWLFVRVGDNGAAPRAAGPGSTGFGLAGLTERVTANGGWLRAGPGIERGWTVDAAVPLREEVRQ